MKNRIRQRENKRKKEERKAFAPREGYPDPTAYRAIVNMQYEKRRISFHSEDQLIMK